MTLIRSILLVWLACFLVSNYVNGVEGGRRLLSKEENIELEKEVKLLNKPAIKSIQTKYGDIYDCVDFYKQPAFDHPLLKNHTFHPQMKPSSTPKLMTEKELSKAKTTSKAFGLLGLKGEGCSPGTVPIRRITKDDLIKEKLFAERYNSNYSVLTAENPGTHYAVAQTKFDSKKWYNGGGATFNIYNPFVNGSQYSSARMKIQNSLESIQIGWTVNPTLYPDNRTRLYTYLNAGQSQCFNTRCPGFVIVDTEVPLDSVLPVSQIGGQTTFVKFLIYRDEPVGNWWLVVGEDNRKIGFWPERIFTSLANSATSVEWGGEVFSPTGIPSPTMGSGDVNLESIHYDAVCETMTSINEVNQLVNAMNTEIYTDIDKYYKVVDVGYVTYPKVYGHVIFFGGPGGYTGK